MNVSEAVKSDIAQAMSLIADIKQLKSNLDKAQ